MKKPDSEILPEYDFSKGERGKYLKSYRDSNIVRLDRDLTGYFSNSEDVNQALREYLRIKNAR